jgi:hypothetical protein
MCDKNPGRRLLWLNVEQGCLDIGGFVAWPLYRCATQLRQSDRTSTGVGLSEKRTGWRFSTASTYVGTMPWNPRQPSIFHAEEWSIPWRSSSSEFPPEETFIERYNRQLANPEWKSIPYFLHYHSQSGGWPWGWAIYRTCYANVSDEDWARAIEKLDEACLASLEFYESAYSKAGKTYVELIREGYRNVIFEDPTLEGASEDAIQRRHRQWVDDHGLCVTSALPRLNYPLLLDERSVRSILASAEPLRPTALHSDTISHPELGGMVGYVNVLDGDFVFEERGGDDGEYYFGLARIHLDCLFSFCRNCERLMDEQDWGSWGMDQPDYVPYVDGRSLEVESKQLFLSTPGRLHDVERTARITELEYKGNQ